jgi:sugar phosphate isomerase/epimerase
MTLTFKACVSFDKYIGVLMMRFGITPLELANVVEIARSGGVLDVSRFNFADILRDTHQQGFSLMELSLDVRYVLPGGLTEDTLARIKAVKKELDLTFTVHLPLWSIEAACPNEYVRKASVECLVDAINFVKPLEPEVYVLHATGSLASEFSRMKLPSLFKGIITDYFVSRAGQSVNEILKRTGIPSRSLALENVEFPFEATWKVAEKFDTSVCLDTGHLISGQSGSIDTLEFVERYFDRLAEVHLHDGSYQVIDEGYVKRVDHKALGKGQLPTIELLTQLEKKSYKGTVIFELTMKEAKESLQFIRQHLPHLPIE